MKGIGNLLAVLVLLIGLPVVLIFALKKSSGAPTANQAAADAKARADAEAAARAAAARPGNATSSDAGTVNNLVNQGFNLLGGVLSNFLN